MIKTFDLIKETLKGKSLYRILFNWEVSKNCQELTGVCLDLASGKKTSSYYRYIKNNFEKIIRIDGNPENKPDIIVDLNLGLTVENDFADNIFLFNSFYMIDKTDFLLSEIFRVLKEDGKFFMTMEFIKAEEATVVDLKRFTSQELKKIFFLHGFKNVKILPIGERFSAVWNLFDFAWGNFTFFRFLKIPFRFFSLFLDKIIPRKLKKNYPCPISWFVIAKK